MNRILKIFTILGFLALGTACEGFLDRQPDDQLTSDDIFKKRSTTEQYLVNVYSWIPERLNMGGNEALNFYANCSDFLSNPYGSKWSHYMHDKMSATSSEFSDAYKNLYRGIREATYFIHNVDRCQDPSLSSEEKKQWKAEARFLRAYYYTELLRLWGPTIMLGDELADFNDPDILSNDRAPWDECVKWVCDEYDLAAADLTDTFLDDRYYGHATKGSALGMKARLLIYNARPLFNGQAPDGESTGMYNGITNRHGKKLFSTEYDPQKWVEAAAACKEVIEFAERTGAHSLSYDEKDPTNVYKNLQSTFTKLNSAENLFAKQGGGTQIRERFRPYGFAKDYSLERFWNDMALTQKMIDAFATKDGIYPVTNIEDADYNAGLNPIFDSRMGTDYADKEFQDSGESYAHPLIDALKITGTLPSVPVKNICHNREPRFYLNVFWNGQYWMQGNGSQISKHPVTFYTTAKNAPGSCNEEGSANYSTTGYLAIKWNNFSLQGSDLGQISWPLLRYADVLLMYVEALIESGDLTNPDLLKYWNMVRKRAGVPNIETCYPDETKSKAEARKLLRRERAVELCVEGVRNFDVRTWMTAENDLSGIVAGCDITQTSDATGYWTRESVYDGRGEGGEPDTERIFGIKQYLYPFPQKELDKMQGLTQNRGW